MSAVEPVHSTIVTPSPNVIVNSPRQARRIARNLSVTEERTLMRTARVRGEGYVQTEKVHEVDNLARESMTGQALLAKWRDTLAGPDVFLADDLRFFSDMAKLGKGEIIADTISTYCRER